MICFRISTYIFRVQCMYLHPKISKAFRSCQTCNFCLSYDLPHGVKPRCYFIIPGELIGMQYLYSQIETGEPLVLEFTDNDDFPDPVVDVGADEGFVASEDRIVPLVSGPDSFSLNDPLDGARNCSPDQRTLGPHDTPQAESLPLSSSDDETNARTDFSQYLLKRFQKLVVVVWLFCIYFYCSLRKWTLSFMCAIRLLYCRFQLVQTPYPDITVCRR